MIAEAPEEDWHNIDAALRQGLRGLEPGSSLSRLLAKQRGKRNRKNLPRLRIRQILRWADAFHKDTGRWPNKDNGPISDAPGETWAAVDAALHNGCRGFRGEDSLAQVLARHRGVRNRKALPPLTKADIVAWADLHCARMGLYPSEKAGSVVDAPGETWAGISMALRTGIRGLVGGTSLFKLLVKHGRISHDSPIRPGGHVPARSQNS